jgi:predicted dinucleotide-binding enzyme
MGEARLHVVFGTGQAGSALAAQLAGLGVAVRVVSRALA